MKRTKKGFTLVELLVVIAILAILASVSVVGYTAFIAKADESVAKQELHQVATLINAELLDDGKWVVSDSITVTLENNTLTWTGIDDATTPVTFDDVIAAYADFAGLEGTFAINGLEISYTPDANTDITVKETLVA